MDEATSASRTPAASALEEPASARRSSLVFPRWTNTEENRGQEEASKCCPFETKGILPNVRILIVVSEVVSAFEVSSTMVR